MTITKIKKKTTKPISKSISKTVSKKSSSQSKLTAKSSVELHKVASVMLAKSNKPVSLKKNLVLKDKLLSAGVTVQPKKKKLKNQTPESKILQTETVNLTLPSVQESKSLFENLPDVEQITKPFQSMDNIDDFHNLTKQNLQAVEKKLFDLRKKSQQIVGLIRFKFNLAAFQKKGNHSEWYSVGKIYNPDATGLRIKFSATELALKVGSFLQSEHYEISIDGYFVFVGLVKKKEDVQLEKHQQTADIQNLSSLIKLSKETLEKAQMGVMSQFTPEEIGSRIWDAMMRYHAYLIDGTKKIVIKDLLFGEPLHPDWDKETFINLIVTDALKI